MTAWERFNVNAQLENLQAKHVGTGHPDTTKFEWAVNMHRDTIASHIGHYGVLAYTAIAENESNGRIRSQFMQRMFQPCGLPPKKDEEEEKS
eukprot:tig00021312_g20080.t1